MPQPRRSPMLRVASSTCSPGGHRRRWQIRTGPNTLHNRKRKISDMRLGLIGLGRIGAFLTPSGRPRSTRSLRHRSTWRCPVACSATAAYMTSTSFAGSRVNRPSRCTPPAATGVPSSFASTATWTPRLRSSHLPTAPWVWCPIPATTAADTTYGWRYTARRTVSRPGWMTSGRCDR